ncbi:phage DNA encapsidation protein [Enterococcus faecium]|uniref:phage DNA encapsidation protein n=1 Tax=Enterococcus faecium TaxID=1352 RepID=UPI000BEF8544|nr:phage DNA encapsidation protein [Enterococcus faecium]PEH49586.1 DNA encapsidation protein [Enterococcus faecium]
MTEVERIPYQREDGWLDVKRIKEEIKQYGFIVGNRGIGKTYGFLDDSFVDALDDILKRYNLQSLEEFNEMPEMVESNIQFFFLRRNLEQIKANIKKIFKPAHFEKFLNSIASEILEQYGFTHEIVGDSKGVRELYMLFRNRKLKKDKRRILVGYASAVTAAEKIRGYDDERIKWIILDEFQAKKNHSYLPNEPAELMDIYDSIARDRAGTGDCKLVALGNAGTILNPYFAYFDYDEFDQVKTEKRDGQIIFYHLENKAKRSEAYKKAIEGTAYGDYALNNAYNDYYSFNLVSLKNRPKPRKILYNIRLNDDIFGVWKDGKNRMILSKVTSADKRTFVDELPRGNEIVDRQTYIMLTSLITNKRLYFDSPEIILIAEKALRKYMYRTIGNSGWEEQAF